MKTWDHFRGWLPIFVLPVSALLLAPATWPRWVVMWCLAFAIYSGCKWLTWRRSSRTLSLLDVGYLVAWPGLDAPTFLGEKPPRNRPTLREWAFAGFKVMVGVLLYYEAVGRLPRDQPELIGWSGMIGIVMILHFGVFHLLSCAWRSVGVDARPIMNWPIKATGLGEFWGQRWNTAFRDLTHRFLFRPLTPRIGGRRALLVVFLFSGLVHDAVISIPAEGGYGGPTLFFVLQSLGIFAERSRVGRGIGLGQGWKGRLFAAIMLLAPASLLFHRPFVTRIILPFLHVTKAL